MRKYQQLFLVIISLISISILLMYKSENNRLKYVLQVVNFFGRNDAAVLSRLENGTKQELTQEFSNPLPVWQRISDDFYLYTAFWEDLDDAIGGNAMTLVAGRKGAIINFKCSFRYDNGTEIRGNFVFMPITGQQSNEKQTEQFAVFKFMCHIGRDVTPNIIQGAPIAVIFTESKSGSKQEVLVHRVNKAALSKVSNSSVVACLNLVPYGTHKPGKHFLMKKNIVQFFMHHQIIGVEDFLVYNGDLVPSEVKRVLLKAGIRVTYFPFNFPFPSKSLKMREIVEMDCLMRTFAASKYAAVLDPNEFIYPNTNLHLKDSVLGWSHYNANVNRLEISTFAVCLDYKNKLLVDNNFYDTDFKVDHKIYISRSTLNPQNVQSAPLPASRIFAHHYINCVSSKDLLYDWRNSVKEDFMQYIQTIRNEISFLF